MNHFKTCVYCLFLFTCVPFSANAKIVFCVDHDIVVMDDDGTNRRRLTRNMHASYPRWSPDGTRIVYEKFINIDGAGLVPKNIYVMNADGTNQRPLLPDPEPDAKVISMRFFPRWSADGTRIVFGDVKDKEREQKSRITVLRIGGRPRVIEDIYDKLGDNLRGTYTCWMDNDRALLFGMINLDKPGTNYDLYKYEFERGRIRC